MAAPRWRLETFDGNVSYDFEINPNQMTNPVPSRGVEWDKGLLGWSGRRAGRIPARWTFSGVTRSTLQYDWLYVWAEKREKLLLTTDLGQTFTVRIVGLELRQNARRQTPAAPWRHEYTISVVSYDSDMIYETFEQSSAFTSGDILHFERTALAAYEGSYGWRMKSLESFPNYRQVVAPHTYRAPLRIQAMMRTVTHTNPSVIHDTGLPSVCVHVPPNFPMKGYQFTLDVRAGGRFALQKDYASTPLAMVAAPIVKDVWYQVVVEVRPTSPMLWGRVYDTNGNQLAEIISNDTSYTEGRVGISAYSVSDFDNVYTSRMIPRVANPNETSELGLTAQQMGAPLISFSLGVATLAPVANELQRTAVSASTLDSGALSVAAQDAEARSVMSSADLSLTAQDVSVSVAPLVRTLDVAGVAVTAQDVVPTFFRTLDAASLTIAAQDVTRATTVPIVGDVYYDAGTFTVIGSGTHPNAINYLLTRDSFGGYNAYFSESALAAATGDANRWSVVGPDQGPYQGANHARLHPNNQSSYWSVTYAAPPPPGQLDSASLVVAAQDPLFGADPYDMLVLAAAPNGYWRLGESSGNFDDRVGSNDATTNGVNITRAVTSLVAGGDPAVQFNGGTSYIATPLVQSAVTAYTVEAVVQTTGADGVIYQNRTSGTTGNGPLTVGWGTGAQGGFGAAGRIFVGVDGAGLFIGRQASSVRIDDGAPHHVVVTWAATSGVGVAVSQFAIYIDGVAVALTDRNIAGSATSPVSGHGDGGQLGYHGNWSMGTVGKIDDLAVYHRALSTSEITAHAAAALNSFTSTFKGNF